MVDRYERLAAYLDELPAGYPGTSSGVELRLLCKLFSPEEADLALHLTLLGEEARVVALRARLPVDEVNQRLAEMAKKGLIGSSQLNGTPPTYSINQFVVGFWEDQVNRLDRETAELFEEYIPHYFEKGPWKILPQIRTIPVRETIPVSSPVLPYEQAEQIFRGNAVIAVRNCVCRQEHQLLGSTCSKPLESCFSFGDAALNTANSGKGRLISLEESLEKLKLAEQRGLVIQPANSQHPAFLCTCCSCCCGVLRNIKKHPAPASLVVNAFAASFEAELCRNCGACVKRCPMEALTNAEDTVKFNPQRCIGCGLCVRACTEGAVRLARKPAGAGASIPINTTHTYVKLGLARRKMTPGSLAGMVLKSTADRIRVRRR